MATRRGWRLAWARRACKVLAGLALFSLSSSHRPHLIEATCTPRRFMTCWTGTSTLLDGCVRPLQELSPAHHQCSALPISTDVVWNNTSQLTSRHRPAIRDLHPSTGLTPPALLAPSFAELCPAPSKLCSAPSKLQRSLLSTTIDDLGHGGASRRVSTVPVTISNKVLLRL